MSYTKGFKAFNKDKTCRGFKFKEGEIYEIAGELEICINGFHFCEHIAQTLVYYPEHENNVYAEVEAIGKILYEEPTKLKAVTNKIKIVRFLTESEVQDMFDKRLNTGYYNTGGYNTGDCNTGYYNTGSYNTGDCNTGNYNTGYYNTGSCNTGDYNTGNYNTGNYNTGYYNTGSCNTGFFNTVTQDILIFNKPCSMEEWVNCDKPQFIFFKPEKGKSYKECFINSYNKASITDKLKIFNIPNFDKDIFLEISGIDVTELEEIYNGKR